MWSLDEMEGDEEGLVRPCGLGDTYWGFWARIMRWVIVPGWGRGRAGTGALDSGCDDEGGLLGWVSLCEKPLRNRTKPMGGVCWGP